mmetsp:Transcript_62476/g.111030  ORF Transcript_62476/g.111030 Transcript_62476/m.111030 type:complete len:97 (-) Transcript_62476:12-302(-)
MHGSAMQPFSCASAMYKNAWKSSNVELGDSPGYHAGLLKMPDVIAQDTESKHGSPGKAVRHASDAATSSETRERQKLKRCTMPNRWSTWKAVGSRS